MAISNIAPADGSLLDAASVVVFDIDDTYTYIRVEVDAAGGVVYAYDSTLGGAQSGYTVAIESSGGTDTFRITADSGWDKNPQIMYVTENETGTEATATITWSISGTLVFPQGEDPYGGQFAATFRVTEDDAGGAANVTWIDVVGPVGGVDGITVTDLGNGKVRLTANATTNDPDAIHDNVAGEINDIAEKEIPHDDDLVIIEDSEADWVKKKVKRKNLGVARNPAKLATDYSPSILYLFDADLTNSGSAGATWDLDNTVTDEIYTVASVPLQRALWMDKLSGFYSDPSLPSADVACVGEVTVQAHCWIGDGVPANGLEFSNIVMLDDNGSGADTLWALVGDTHGSAVMQPGFQYYDTDSSLVSVTNADFLITPGAVLHMVGRRKDNGAGLYDVSLWTNGVKIAETLAQKAARPATSGDQVYVCKTTTGDKGFCRSAIEGIKVVNRALTDEEIGIEYRAVVGAPVV